MITEVHSNLTPWKPGISPNPGGKPKAPTQIMRIVREAAGNASLGAINTLIEVMGDKKAKPQARVVAACAILDRAIGKPKEFIEITKTNPFDGMSVTEIMAMMEQIKIAKAQTTQAEVIENES